MRNDVVEMVGVSLNGEIKTPPLCDSGLPDVTCLIVLLGLERGVAEILKQKLEASLKCALDMGRSALIAPAKALAVDDSH